MTRRIDPALIPSQPNLSFEHSLWNEEILLVAGVDEAGRGSLAGPVSAGAVVLPPLDEIQKTLSGVQDSKQLSAAERAEQKILIESTSKAWAVGFADNAEIDQVGIVGATQLAIQRAVYQLIIKPQHLLVDYLVLPNNPLPQTRLVKGDARSLSIAAASILAKTHRDEWMTSVAKQYPEYNFEANKGYGTADHLKALETYGHSALHRMTFKPMRDME
ncbi:MAG: ribonuclease HII [Anaerolineales bacterium]|nr:ribonuclease HII [Anaerolineales bacterium]